MGGIKSLVLITNAIICFVMIASQVFVLVPFSHPVTNAPTIIVPGALNKITFNGKDAYSYDIYIFNSTSISGYISSAITFIAHQLNIMIGAPPSKLAMTFTPLSDAWQTIFSEISIVQPHTVNENAYIETLMNTSAVFDNIPNMFNQLDQVADIQLTHPSVIRKVYFQQNDLPIYFIALPNDVNNIPLTDIQFSIYMEPDEIILFGKSMYVLFAIIISFGISASSGINFMCPSCCRCWCRGSSGSSTSSQNRSTEMKVIGARPRAAPVATAV